MIFTPKLPLVSENGICVADYGPANPIGPTAYFFADVLDELIFHAQKHEARGILLGGAFLLPETAEENIANAQKTNSFPIGLTAPDYLEITAFRDIYPTDNAMDYAGYLRRILRHHATNSWFWGRSYSRRNRKIPCSKTSCCSGRISAIHGK